jgi:hypothetical protein
MKRNNDDLTPCDNYHLQMADIGEDYGEIPAVIL